MAGKAHRQRRSRRWRLAFVLVLVALAWACAPALAIWQRAHADQARPSDCIIVLGAAAYHTRPSPVFEERIRHAIDLYRAGMAGTLVFTGGYGTGAAHAESEVARDYAIAHGVPAADILVETRSRTTRANLEEAAALMRRDGLRTAILVSDPFHLERAARIAEAAGIEAVTSPTPTSRFRSWRTRLGFLARETWFLHRERLFGY
jgi:uncharacterized SAM-binding protein YcdF (DUF218 family)